VELTTCKTSSEAIFGESHIHFYEENPKGLVRVVSHLFLAPQETLGLKLNLIECKQFFGATLASKSPSFT
jgi:hypothetical protein